MAMDYYPAPDPKFEAQAIALMMKRQEQLNQVVAKAEEGIETPVEIEDE